MKEITIANGSTYDYIDGSYNLTDSEPPQGAIDLAEDISFQLNNGGISLCFTNNQPDGISYIIPYAHGGAYNDSNMIYGIEIDYYGYDDGDYFNYKIGGGDFENGVWSGSPKLVNPSSKFNYIIPYDIYLNVKNDDATKTQARNDKDVLTEIDLDITW